MSDVFQRTQCDNMLKGKDGGNWDQMARNRRKLRKSFIAVTFATF